MNCISASNIRYCIYGDLSSQDEDNIMIGFMPDWDFDDNGEDIAYKLIELALPSDTSLAAEWSWEYDHENVTQQDVDVLNKKLQGLGYRRDPSIAYYYPI